MAGSDDDYSDLEKEYKLFSGKVVRIKARHIREELRGKIDPILLKHIEAIAEEQSVLKQQLLDVAFIARQTQQLLQQMMNVMGVMQERAVMKDPVDEVKKKDQQDDGSNLTI